jgi:hypothetical protein
MKTSLGRTPERVGNPKFKEQYLEFFSKVRRRIANIMYNENVFKSIIEQYDQGKKREVYRNTCMGILNKIQSELTGGIDLPTMFAAGMTVFNDLNMDIAATGREPLTQKELDSVAREVMINFLELHKGNYDPEELKQYLMELQYRQQTGELEQTLGDVAKLAEQEAQQKMQKSEKGLIKKAQGS